MDFPNKLNDYPQNVLFLKKLILVLQESLFVQLHPFYQNVGANALFISLQFYIYQNVEANAPCITYQFKIYFIQDIENNQSK